MLNGIGTTIRTAWKKITLAAIVVLFFVVHFLIFVGELTQKIILYPFIYTYKVTRLLVISFITVFTLPKEQEILEEKPIVLKKTVISTESFTPFKKEVLFKTFRKKKLKKITVGLVKKISSAVTFTIKKIGSLIWSFFVLVYYAIIRSPLYFFYFVNELFYFIYSIFKSIIQLIINFYRYLTGPYFRSFLYGIAFCLILVIGYHGYQFVQDLPSPRSIGILNYAKSTHLYDRNGKLLYEIYRDVSRTPITVSELPPHVVQATIAIEDKHFYNHKGVSFFGGILRAAKDTYKTKELQGGSTITQQLVKSALLSPERTVERKLKEITLAVWTEQMYSKDQIMEMYLNQVPYGGAAYGIEEASNIYFGKSAKYLTLNEAALLAGLPQAPSIYSPFINPEAAEARRNVVLNNMYELGYISRKEKDNAVLAKVEILPPRTNINAPHFVFYTRNKMEELYGSKAVEEGGFKVITSLDLEIQEKAEAILSEELEKIKDLNVSNGGIIVMDPRTGEILTMVGSNNYFNETDGAFNVTTALRQPGSTLKPMLYAMALERGFTAATMIDDSPIVFANPGGEPYRPVNYDGAFHGRITMRYALSNSYNIPAVKVLNMMGVQQFVDFGKEMGIDTWQDSSRFGLSLSLGGGEVTLVDLAQVYGVFATGGYRTEPTPFKQIIDHKEHIMYQAAQNPRLPVLDPGIAYIISDILSDTTARRQTFGTNSALDIAGHKVAVKTGTTNDKKDNLTVGYTPEFLVAVWVGNNDNTPMHPTLTSGITGAAPIWNKVMTYLLEEKSEGIEFTAPSNVVAKPCYGGGRNEYFLTGTEVQGYCFDSNIKPREEGNKQEARNPSL